ncbi:MAG TPA: DNA repair protein RecO [Tepidisphaeraceae bacterium]|jgi:DNA repair protein RecO (recombination protein O)
MPLVHDRCICVRKFEYSETSQILTLFSRDHGLLRLIAKGAHRRTKAGSSKFDGGLDLLDVGAAVFTHDPAKELGALTEWKLQEGHLELRNSLRGIYLAQYAAELVGLLIEEHDPHPELFDRFEASLPEFAQTRVEEAFLAFELDLLRETGYLAMLSQCASCGQEISEREGCCFSPARGGIVCRNCQGSTPDRIEFDLRLLRLIQGLLRLPRSNGVPQRLPRLTRHQTDPLNRLFAEQIEHTLGRRLRMPRWVIAARD